MHIWYRYQVSAVQVVSRGAACLVSTVLYVVLLMSFLFLAMPNSNQC